MQSALAADILGGRDPLDDPAVQRAATAVSISEARALENLNDYAYERADLAIVEHADNVIDTWRPLVEGASKAFADFRPPPPRHGPAR